MYRHTAAIVAVIGTAAAAFLAGCSSSSYSPILVSSSAPSSSSASRHAAPSSSGAWSVDSYKRDVAERISQVNAAKVYPGRPQALLRSVIVVKYVIDAHGNLVRSDIVRSNRDRENEATALASLRNSQPFPKPASHLLSHGRLEVSETWLFNNDGRFQLRTIAQPQMDS
ncbi:hypothetical protein E4K72_17240 [Oxalobacteraceae bacterium OM1]|nr:hypothetical protein E4K72_17240 [Oxalobacteraceae bacterium OM1]